MATGKGAKVYSPEVNMGGQFDLLAETFANPAMIQEHQDELRVVLAGMMAQRLDEPFGTTLDSQGVVDLFGVLPGATMEADLVLGARGENGFRSAQLRGLANRQVLELLFQTGGRLSVWDPETTKNIGSRREELLEEGKKTVARLITHEYAGIHDKDVMAKLASTEGTYVQEFLATFPDEATREKIKSNMVLIGNAIAFLVDPEVLIEKVDGGWRVHGEPTLYEYAARAQAPAGWEGVTAWEAAVENSFLQDVGMIIDTMEAAASTGAREDETMVDMFKSVMLAADRGHVPRDALLAGGFLAMLVTSDVLVSYKGDLKTIALDATSGSALAKQLKGTQDSFFRKMLGAFGQHRANEINEGIVNRLRAVGGKAGSGVSPTELDTFIAAELEPVRDKMPEALQRFVDELHATGQLAKLANLKYDAQYYCGKVQDSGLENFVPRRYLDGLFYIEGLNADGKTFLEFSCVDESKVSSEIPAGSMQSFSHSLVGGVIDAFLRSGQAPRGVTLTTNTDIKDFLATFFNTLAKGDVTFQGKTGTFYRFNTPKGYFAARVSHVEGSTIDVRFVRLFNQAETYQAAYNRLFGSRQDALEFSADHPRGHVYKRGETGQNDQPIDIDTFDGRDAGRGDAWYLQGGRNGHDAVAAVIRVTIDERGNGKTYDDAWSAVYRLFSRYAHAHGIPLLVDPPKRITTIDKAPIAATATKNVNMKTIDTRLASFQGVYARQLERMEADTRQVTRLAAKLRFEAFARGNDGIPTDLGEALTTGIRGRGFKQSSDHKESEKHRDLAKRFLTRLLFPGHQGDGFMIHDMPAGVAVNFAENSYTLDLAEADQALRRLAHRRGDSTADALYAVVHAAFQELMAQGHTVININDPGNPAFRTAYEWYQAFSQSQGKTPDVSGQAINPLDVSPARLVAYLKDTFRVPASKNPSIERGLKVTRIRVGTMIKQEFQAAPGAGEGALTLTDASHIVFVPGSTTGKKPGSGGHPGAAAVEVSFTFMGVALTACIDFHSEGGSGYGLFFSSTFGRVVMGGQTFANMADALSGMTRLDARARAYGLTAVFSRPTTSTANEFRVDILQGSKAIAEEATLSYSGLADKVQWRISFGGKLFNSPQSFVDETVKSDSVLSAQVQAITDALKVGDSDSFNYWITGFTWVDLNAFTVDIGLRPLYVGDEDFDQLSVVYTFNEVAPGMYQVHVSLPGSTAPPLLAFSGSPLSLEEAVLHVATLTSTLCQIRPQGESFVGWHVTPNTVTLLQGNGGCAVLGFTLTLRQYKNKKLAVATNYIFDSQAFTLEGGMDLEDLNRLTRLFREAGKLPVVKKSSKLMRTGATIQDVVYDPAACVMEFSISCFPVRVIVGQDQLYSRARFNVRTGAFALFHQATGTWHDWGSYQTWWATHALSLKTVPNTGGKTHIRNVAWQSFDGNTGVRFSFEYYDAQTGTYVAATGTAAPGGQQDTVHTFKVEGSDVDYVDVRIFAAIHALGLDVKGGVGTIATWHLPHAAAGPTVAFSIKDPTWSPGTNHLDVKFDADNGLFLYLPHIKMNEESHFKWPFLVCTSSDFGGI